MSERENFGLIVECPAADDVVHVLRSAVYRVPDPRTGNILCIRQKVSEEVMLEAVEDASGNVIWTPQHPKNSRMSDSSGGPASAD